LLSPLAIENTTVSNVLPNNKEQPHWQHIESGIKYRGTFSELRHEQMQIKIYNNTLFLRQVIGSKTVELKNSMNSLDDVSFIKEEMVIHKHPGRQGHKTCQIQGNVSTGKMPKYAQTGDINVITKKEYYLVVQMQKLAVFESIEDAGGDMTVYATVEWFGVERRTRGVRRPNVNEQLMFHIPIEDAYKHGDPAELARYIQDKLQTKPEIVINVWATTARGNLENLGNARVCLKELSYAKF
jgi:hypothetical protein